MDVTGAVLLTLSVGSMGKLCPTGVDMAGRVHHLF